MKGLEEITHGLLILGALNWGLAVLNTNLITALFGTGMVTTIIYGLIGIAGILALIKLK